MTSTEQLSLFDRFHDIPTRYPFPSTRYQGSKQSLVSWIWDHLREIAFESVLDVFGGTGVVSHWLKNEGKQVTYNDRLRFNWTIGVALIENRGETLTASQVDQILARQPGMIYPDFIQQTFQGIYFTDSENAWLDQTLHNIDHLLTTQSLQALARFAVFQASLSKRPYNLFHRANLYMRTAQVERSFGNKTTWDTPFEILFRQFVHEANQAVFDNGQNNVALCLDALETPQGADLVYVDPPYLNSKGIGVDYRDFYHFLEGLTQYAKWGANIDYTSKHRRLHPEKSRWLHPSTLLGVFEQLIERHRQSILVISYREDGVPSKHELVNLLGKYKKRVIEAVLPKKYVLSSKNSHELLLIGTH
jgi:DNA adenine methylase/adenine-specific DNA-methyltransferase